MDTRGTWGCQAPGWAVEVGVSGRELAIAGGWAVLGEPLAGAAGVGEGV